MRLRAFLSKACPFDVFPPIGTNPLIPSDFRAALTAFANFATFLYASFPCAWAFLETTFPCLFLIKELLRNPPDVRALDPLNTRALAPRPFATLLTRFAFFMAFIAFFMDFFMVAFFMTAFIAFFIDFAMILLKDLYLSQN